MEHLSKSPNLDSVIIAVKKILRGEELMAEGMKELEHLGVKSAIKTKTEHARDLVKAARSSKLEKLIKKKDSFSWRSRYATDPDRQKEVLESVKKGDWNSIASISSSLKWGSMGVGYVLHELRKQKKVRTVVKKGNPKHKGSIHHRHFEYWEAV